MRPFVLKGHERAITRVRCNKDGDLLFTTAKDKHCCLWYTENGERVGTYNAAASIFDVDVAYDSRHVITGSGDNMFILWDTETGSKLGQMDGQTGIKAVGFGYTGNLVFYCSTARMRLEGKLCVLDIRDGDHVQGKGAVVSIPLASTANAAVWSRLEEKITTGHEKGEIFQYDLRSGNEPVNFNQEEHARKDIRDIQMSEDQTMMITASKDKTAKLWDAQGLEVKKTYKAERPVNSAVIAPDYSHIILAGGEEAMQVTQTTQTGGHFEAKFYHLIFEEEYARVKGHFGPINSICYLPTDDTFVTGGEDGFVRIQKLDDDLKQFEMDY